MDNKEYQREWHLKNKDKIKKYRKRYKEKQKKIMKKYYLENKDNIKLYNQKYYLSRKEELSKKHSLWSKNWRKNMTEEQRVKIRASIRKYNKSLRLKAISAYGGKCACCNENKIDFLAIDHINGEGSKHRLETFGKKNSGGNTTYRWLKRNNYPSGFQVLCHNCNLSKGFYGYCPHNK